MEKINKEIAANDILKMLISKHQEKFVCIPECKTGKSYGSGNHRIDFWCMAKSWSQPRTIAYEIKVSRSDFLSDHKWRHYLPYCSEFYFAAPWGVIDTNELPKEAGLIQTSKNLSKLYIKKKAPAREVNIPENIFRYILMWRAVIDDKKNTEARYHISNKDYWAKWLKDKNCDSVLGRSVSSALQRRIQKMIDAVNSKNICLEREINKLSSIKSFIEELGVNIDSWNLQRDVECELTLMPKLLSIVDSALKNMGEVKKIIEEYEKKR